MTDYITKDSIIIFSPYFNGELDIEFLSNYKQIIFSNYELNDELFDAYANNEFKNLKYIGSKYDLQIVFPQKLIYTCICSYLTLGHKFNHEINLPENLTHLTFGFHFNQSVNLPKNITHLTFGGNFNQPVNLPENLTYLTFGSYFNQPVNLPEN